jgi:hypothetical protein
MAAPAMARTNGTTQQNPSGDIACSIREYFVGGREVAASKTRMGGVELRQEGGGIWRMRQARHGSGCEHAQLL